MPRLLWFALVCWLLFVMVALPAAFQHLCPGDEFTYRALQAWRSPFLDWVFHRVTKAGTATILVPVGIVVFLWQHTHRQMLLFLGGYSLGVIVLERGAKLLIARPRPVHYLVTGPLLQTSHGFPSGHVLAATAFYGMTLILLQKTDLPRGWQCIITGLLVCTMLLVGVSRLYLGAHWLSDVVGGFALGGAYCSLAVAVYDRLERRADTHCFFY